MTEKGKAQSMMLINSIERQTHPCTIDDDDDDDNSIRIIYKLEN